MGGANTTESKWSISGHYKNDKLIEILYQYINLIVICSSCSIPELLPSVEGKKKNKKLTMACSACGHSEVMIGGSKERCKGIDLIIKFMDKNEWKIKKGTMVMQDESDLGLDP